MASIALLLEHFRLRLISIGLGTNMGLKTEFL